MARALTDLVPDAPSFRTSADVRPALDAAVDARPGLASRHDLGTSEEGRPLVGYALGRGPLTVSLVAGHHADEPVGPETLRTLVTGLLAHPDPDPDARKGLTGAPVGEPVGATWLQRFRFLIVPHANPDGEARNRPWIAQWPDPAAYLRHVDREPPGRDLEFGFPAMRPENEAVADFMRTGAPLALHASLHGMALSEGAMLLVSRTWTWRSEALQEGFRAAARAEGLRMHDHNRKGEKGFFRIGPGITTTPRGDAMRAFFRAQDDERMASRFHSSSMEMAQGLGGDPLCLVTELPLFVVETDENVLKSTEHASEPGVPRAYLDLKARLPEVRHAVENGQPFAEAIAPHRVRPLPLATAMRLQLRALELGLEEVARGRDA